MQLLPLRLLPGDDLRRAIESQVADAGATAAFVVSGIGSLSSARLRLAGAADALALEGDLEIVSLAGTIAVNGSHLHAALAGADGALLGGHLGYGCVVRTTAELLVALVPDRHFERALDPRTGFAELQITARPGDPAP